MATQIANQAEGDIAAGNITKTVNIARERTPMTKLVEQFLAETEGDKELKSITEKLAHFLSKKTDSDILGLEEKLNISNRGDLIEDALIRKQQAYKLIMLNQGSPSAQVIFSYILAEIVVNFEQAVRPKIQNGASREEIDLTILNQVLNPALKSLEDNPLMLNKIDIQGLLYFLGGNCHLRWDAC